MKRVGHKATEGMSGYAADVCAQTEAGRPAITMQDFFNCSLSPGWFLLFLYIYSMQFKELLILLSDK